MISRLLEDIQRKLYINSRHIKVNRNFLWTENVLIENSFGAHAQQFLNNLNAYFNNSYFKFNWDEEINFNKMIEKMVEIVRARKQGENYINEDEEIIVSRTCPLTNKQSENILLYSKKNFPTFPEKDFLHFYLEFIDEEHNDAQFRVSIKFYIGPLRRLNDNLLN